MTDVHTATVTAEALPRVDARGKVTGTVHYGSDRVPPGLLHAALVTSTIACGRLTGLDTAAAEAATGVRLVLRGPAPDGLVSPGFIMGGGHGFQSLQPLVDDTIAYRGQPIAVVVADTPHEATAAAALVHATYDATPAAVSLDADGTETVDQQDVIPLPMFADVQLGDADAAYAAAPVRVDASYECPPQHPSPMELIGGVVAWEGDRLTIHEGTQNAASLRFGVATALGIDPADVRVVSPYVGGGFGNKNSLQCQTALAAVAARRLDRPVKLVLTRSQMYLSASFRPASHHRVRLGADVDGTLCAAIHEIDQQTSRHDAFPAAYTETTSRMYGIPAFRGHQRLVRTDTQTPGYMRAPHEHPGSFAFESAVDELAVACGVDPVQLRLANDTRTDPVTGHPFSSRHLDACLRRGADTFGWSGRDPVPGSMHGADGSLVGWGVAAGAYPGTTVAGITRLTADTDGGVTVHVGGHEMGQGIRTAITTLVRDDLGLPPDRITVDVGDTQVVPQHLTAGAWGTATALPGVRSAIDALRTALGAPRTGPFDLAAAVRADGRPEVSVEVDTTGPGQPRDALDSLRGGGLALSGPEYPGFTTFSYAAHFVEVHIEPTTSRVRVRRVVSTIDCGRVISPVTARSQVRGGVIWGLGAALREVSQPDPTHGGFVNDNLADYVVPVMADLPDIEVQFVDEPDTTFNPLGVKSLGEVVMVGVAAAIANAVHHATGVRHRRLPLRLEDVLQPDA